MFKSYHIYTRHNGDPVSHAIYTNPDEAQRHFAAAKLCGLTVSCFGRRTRREATVLLCFHDPNAGSNYVKMTLEDLRRGMRLRRLKARAEGSQK